MQTASFSLTCSDGHQMPVYSWLPAAAPVCVVHIAHGMAEFAERYAPIAQLLTQQNIAVYAHDQRGHGKAVASLNDLGIVGHNWFYQQVEDVQLMVSFLRKKHPGNKIFLLGHSMGSFVCQRYFQMHGSAVDGLILSASNGKQDPLMPAGIAIAWLQMKLFGERYRSHLIDKLSFGKFNAAFKPNRTGYDWLSRNPPEIDQYIADPRCGFVSSALYFYYFFEGIQDAFKKSNIMAIPPAVPVYAFAGDKDPVGLQGKGFLTLINNWKAAGSKDITYDLYKEGRHEMMNDTNREEVVTNIVKWIQQHL